MCGSERTGPVGREGPDCDKTAPWAIQCKRAPTPTLPASWLRQAQRDAERDELRRPWVLVQSWYRRGRPTTFLATTELRTLALYSAKADFGTRLHRSASKPRLSRVETLELLGAQEQPWLLVQHIFAGVNLATLDFRVLCQLGRRAGVVSDQPTPELRGAV